MSEESSSENKSPISSPEQQRSARRLSRRQFFARTGGGLVAAAVASELLGSVGCGVDNKSESPATSAEVTRRNRERRAVTPGMTFVVLNVNGRERELEVDPRWSLADVLRKELGLTGTKVGCERAECGACTVLMDGLPVYSCMVLAVASENKAITTIEGLASGGQLHPVQAAFQEAGGMQCGFCTPGMIMAAKALLDNNPNPTDEEIRKGLAGNLCRCTGYYKIIEAVKLAAKNMAQA